jgi:AraC family transcriptional regulator
VLSRPRPSDALVRALRARERDGAPGGARGALLAAGPGWRAYDIVCTAGPRDRSFEESHPSTSVSAVVAGSFRYRSAHGAALLAPGALLLGNRGQAFVCDHDHARGDRCVSFHYEPPSIEEIAAQLSVPARGDLFRTHRLAPGRTTGPLLAELDYRLADATADGDAWDELAVTVAGRALTLAGEARGGGPATATEERRVTGVLRFIDAHLAEPLGLARLAAIAGTSRYHFLRTFRHVAGVSPHQYVIARRLAEAALRLRTSDRGVLEIAVAVGFNDASHFTHTFKREFGAAPAAYRAAARTR